MLEILQFSLFYLITFLFFSSSISLPSSVPQVSKQRIYSYFSSLIHSISCLGLSLYSHLQTSGVSYNSSNTSLQTTIISVLPTQHTLGYFVYDLIIGLLYSNLDLPMVLHHICGLVGGYSLLLRQEGGSATVVVILLTENTSPFLQLKNILKLMGKRENMFSVANDLIFAILFVWFRPFFGWILSYNMLVSDLNWIVKANTVGMYSLGVMWTFDILAIVQGKITGNYDGIVRKFRQNLVLFILFLAVVAVGLPYAVGSYRDFEFIHMKYKEFVII